MLRPIFPPPIKNYKRYIAPKLCMFYLSFCTTERQIQLFLHLVVLDFQGLNHYFYSGSIGCLLERSPWRSWHFCILRNVSVAKKLMYGFPSIKIDNCYDTCGFVFWCRLNLQSDEQIILFAQTFSPLPSNNFSNMFTSKKSGTIISIMEEEALDFLEKRAMSRDHFWKCSLVLNLSVLALLRGGSSSISVSFLFLLLLGAITFINTCCDMFLLCACCWCLSKVTG